MKVLFILKTYHDSDKYFENKLNYLFGLTDKPDLTISEDSILNFHLAHRTNPDFIFEPKKNTNPLIWKYLSTSNQNCLPDVSAIAYKLSFSKVLSEVFFEEVIYSRTHPGSNLLI